MADVFAELEKEKGGLWNRKSKEALNAIGGKGKALSTGKFIYVDSDTVSYTHLTLPTIYSV